MSDFWSGRPDLNQRPSAPKAGTPSLISAINVKGLGRVCRLTSGLISGLGVTDLFPGLRYQIERRAYFFVQYVGVAGRGLYVGVIERTLYELQVAGRP
jgi:hypothetical protein